ncbi:MAG: hypothetical protein OJF59_002506 [Cytophagales bacterium]|jgi:hypothetical protein|nr:hypothetical protein [Bacteroidota bacterium]MBS1980231.1 hypothetical protein [Bacteroidota bacterium]WHZ08752.1 MAG: hypothetical protein OJF59_002506 [Cytophagales bacterium]
MEKKIKELKAVVGKLHSQNRKLMEDLKKITTKSTIVTNPTEIDQTGFKKL